MRVLNVCTDPPTIITPNVIWSAEGDTNVTITCTATGTHLPKFNWTGPRNNALNDTKYYISKHSLPVLVLDGNSEVFQVTSKLTIVSVKREDAGLYFCNVSNDVESNTTLIVMCKCFIKPGTRP